jgi:PIN domain nuclease of toxin-antitoxin system
MTSDLLILDTHIWIWAVSGEIARISTDALEAIEIASRNNQLGVCAISVWEVGMLESKGRIQCGTVCLDWVRKALSAPGLRLIPLTPEIAIESSRLPGGLHGDPADRILAASSRVMKATLVTKDLKLLAYAALSFMSAIEG